MKGKKPRDFTRLAQEDKAIRGGIVNGNLIYIIVFLVKICVILWLVTPATAQLADTPWPMFHHDLNHTGLSSNYGPDTNSTKWIFTNGDKIFGSAAIAEDGTIYVGTRKCASTYGSNLYAIYPDGTVRWNWSAYHAVDFTDSTPAVASDGTVYVGSWDKCLYAFYPDGTKKWKFCTSKGGFVLTSPAIAPDATIYIGNKNKKLYAINPDGTKKWEFATGESIKSSPAIAYDGTIYVGSNDNKLYAIYPNSTQKWSYLTGGKIKSSPAIGADGTIYVGSDDGKLHAINPNSTQKWSYLTGDNIISSPAIGADGTVYVGSNNGKLYAIYPNGTKKWSYLTGGRVKSSPAIDADGTVYVGSKDGYVYAINPNGTLLWKYNTGNKIYYSSPAIASDGTVYIGNIGNKDGNGKLYAFGPGVSSCGAVIEVNKTVWDPVAKAWVEEISDANINQTYRFRCEVHNNGSCCDLSDIKVVDNLSDSMEYKNNATVDGVSQEPDWQTDNQFGWNFTGPLAPSQRMVIEFDANVTDCGNDSNVQNATAYCSKTNEWVSDEDDAWVNVSDGADCGSDYYDSYVNYCKGDEVWKRRQFHDFYCEAGACADHMSWENDTLVENCSDKDYYDDFVTYCKGDEVWMNRTFHDFICEGGACVEYTSTVEDQFVENCSDSDGWYNTTNTSWVNDTECTEKEQQEQEYWDYTCSDGACVYSVTCTQWVDTGAVRNKPDGTDCGTDYYDSPVKYCNVDEVREHQWFHNFSCEAGNCTDHTSWENDTLVENCNLKDGWYNTTNTSWVNDTECTEKEQQEQEYRDYTCSDGVCTFSVTGTQWVDTGSVRDKLDGTDCGTDYSDPFENYCKGDEVWKQRMLHNFYCEAGVCTDHTSWVNDTFVENCSDSDGGYNTTNTRWVNDTECTEKEQQEQEYWDYTCSDGACAFSVTSTQWVDTGAVRNKTDGTVCGYGTWEDDPDNPGQERREILKCSEGTCTESGEYEYRPKGISIAVEPELTLVQPQDQFDVNITVNPDGKPVYAVEYYLHYDTSVVRAETQNKGSFLGNDSETWVGQNNINQATGVIHYAETRTENESGVTEPGTVATIQFTAIGAPGATSNLNFSGVIIVNSTTNESYDQIYTINGSIEISNNIPPVANGTSKHKINNVAKKYPCNTTLCSCSYDENYPGKGGNITYLQWAFGDGQYGTSEGLPDENNCTCEEHKYQSWQWEPFGVAYPDGHYVPFTVYLTVTDDGCPEETSTTNFDVNVYIAGDANGDGRVNILDGAYVGKHWSDCCCGDPSCPCYPDSCDSSVSACMEYLWGELQQDEADLNNDCNINILDAMIIGANWGHVAW